MKYEVKICGLTRREDVEAAVEAGADYVGFVLADFSPRHVTPEQLAVLTRDLPRHVKKVGVFVNAAKEFIFSTVKTGSLDVVQLHGEESAEFARSLRGLTVWKAAHLTSLADVDFYASYPAERIVTDAEAGGSGELSSWELEAELAGRKRVMLAGGISPGNAAEALRKVNPAGLDLASGVEESAGIKSKEKIVQLFQNIKGAVS